MIYAVLLPLVAAFYIFAATFLKKKSFAWEVGTATAAFAFLNIVSMAFKNHLHGKIYSLGLLPFITLNGVRYRWQMYFDTTEIFLAVFIVFCALMCLIYAKNYLPENKIDAFVIFLLGLTSSAVIGIGAKNMFQFFAGWDMSMMFAYLLLMLFHEKQAVRRSGVNFLIWHALGDVPLMCACYMLANRTGSFMMADFTPEMLNVFDENGAVPFAMLLLLGVSAKLFLFGTNILITQTAGISVPALAFVAPAVLGGLGVYVLYVFFPFVGHNETVRLIFAVWGALTAVGGVVIAAVQTNVKILLSQLLMGQFGFVLAVFGVIGRVEAFCAFIALITPVTGLILGAGTVIRALQGEEDFVRMGGLKKTLPLPYRAMMLFSVCSVGFPHIGNSGIVSDMYAVLEKQGASFGVAGLTLFLFGSAFMLARLIYKMFLTTPRLAVSATAKITEPAGTQLVPLLILLTLSLFQNKVFEQSVLPDAAGVMNVKITVMMLVGTLGLPVGFWFFRHKESQTSAYAEEGLGAKVGRVCLNGFYLNDVYNRLFVRPFNGLAEFAWRFAGAEFLTEKVPSALKRLAEKMQKIRAKQAADYFVWTLTGLFILLLLLWPLTAGGNS